MIRASKIAVAGLCLSALVTLSSFFEPEEKVRVGFLVHDLVTARWQTELENFSRKITELGGEPVTRNAFGDTDTQIKQGKELIDDGVKVIAVVAQNGKALGELVEYANNAGATIVGYDRMILNCDLHYYISFNSIQVGELMADYSLSLKPKGNYVILNGPSTDNNASLVRQGVMSKLAPAIQRGDIRILADQEMDSWNALSSFMFMEDFLSSNKAPVDAIITASDDLVAGVLDAMKIDKVNIPVLTGQNATVDACRNIMDGLQAMTVYKNINKLSTEGALMCMKIAKGEKVETTATTHNGKIDVPSILFEPVVVDKSNLSEVMGPDYIKDAEIR